MTIFEYLSRVGNKWLQQQIPACRPVFSANHVGIAFIIIGVVFIAMGIAFTVVSIRVSPSCPSCFTISRPLQTHTSYAHPNTLTIHTHHMHHTYTHTPHAHTHNLTASLNTDFNLPPPPTHTQLREFEFSYTNCSSSDRPDGFSHCEDYLDSIANMTNDERRDTEDCHCTISIKLPQSLRPPWNIYYGMDNYYQNHRRYLNSWDINQLRSSGDDLTRGPSSDCRPLIRQDRKPIVPCGLIANSWFNGECVRVYILYT